VLIVYRGGHRGFEGYRAAPQKILFFGPYIRLGRPTYCFVHFFAHGFGHDGFRSMVLDASTCINMYCNIERNIMKNQAGSPGFGIRGKSLCICVLYVMLSHYLFSVF